MPRSISLYRPFAGLVGAAVLATGCARAPTLDESRIPGLSELAAAIDADRLMASVHAIVAEHRADTPVDCAVIGISDPDSEGCHLTRDRAREYLRRELETLGYEVREHRSGQGPLATTNLIAERRGTTRPDEIVLLGAHFDVFHAAADDNSTGVAALIEIARALSDQSFDRTVRFVGFDLEELQFTGSARYVADVAKDENIVAALVLDSIGYRRSDEGSQTAPPGLAMPTVGDFLAVIANGRSAGLSDDVWLLNERLTLTKVATIEAPGRGEAALIGDLLRSDHGPFWLVDRPALFFTDTTNFRNEHFHKPTDTPDTLDPAFLSEVTRLTAVSLAYWAGGVR